MAGGAGWAGAPAALLRSVRRLREVFEVCGRDPDGFLRVERVAALGLRFGQGEEPPQATRLGWEPSLPPLAPSPPAMPIPTTPFQPNAVQVEKLVKYLDPNDLGRINFKDFCRGVFAMKGCEELLKDVLSVESAGTPPCAPEIPDCVEQVRGGWPQAPPPAEGWGLCWPPSPS
ncbi:hypothetical protein MC885_004278 [Smutsia gigantea]|nr:hypothetical protein MC885_004278 [Smutsia gigantea]